MLNQIGCKSCEKVFKIGRKLATGIAINRKAVVILSQQLFC